MKPIIRSMSAGFLFILALLPSCGPTRDDPDAGGLPSVCPACVPDCEGKECGPDGCGGECGSCTSPFPDCTGDCSPWPEVLDCNNRMCGPDPAHGFPCGDCPSGWTCDLQGQCRSPSGTCADVPAGGLCTRAGWRIACEAGEIVLDHCRYDECDVDPATQEARCAEVPCLPDCYGRTCGDDGCGGSCGVCEEGEACQAQLRVCVPEAGCAAIGEAGECRGHVLVSCGGGRVSLEDCLLRGMLCRPAEPGTRASCCPQRVDEPCGDLPEHNACAGDYHVFCSREVLYLWKCSWSLGMTCGRVGMRSLGCR